MSNKYLYNIYIIIVMFLIIIMQCKHVGTTKFILGKFKQLRMLVNSGWDIYHTFSHYKYQLSEIYVQNIMIVFEQNFEIIESPDLCR